MRQLTIVLLVCAVVGCAGSGGGASSATKSETSQPTSATDPLHSLALMRQGTVLMQQGRFDEALENFKRADQIAPGNATVHNMIGLCYLRTQRYDQALLSFDRALNLVPGFTDARNNRGATYLALGQYHMAEVDFIAVLSDSTYPNRLQVYYNLGMAYLQRGHLGAAEENFRQAITSQSPVPDAYLRLSELAQRRGEMETSLGLLEDARFRFPERIDILEALGQQLMIMGREDEARPYLEKVIEAEPSSEAADRARALLGTT